MKANDARRWGVALGFAAAVSAIIPPPSAAAPQTVAEIAGYTGPDRQAVLEAGARKEGELLVYTAAAVNKGLDDFARKYPFIQPRNFGADAPSVTRRVLEEYRAGRHVVDGYELNIGALRPIRDAGHLQAFLSPEFQSTRPEAIDPGRYWVHDYASYLSLGYNTKLISEKDVPSSYDDLLDPKWQGKMAIPGTSTLGNGVGVIVIEKGEDFVRKLGPQKIKVFEITGRAVANFVVSGEVPLSPSIFSSHMANSASQGAGVGWRALGGVYSTIGAVALAAKAPHPHAAMLFLDYMLSKDAQVNMQKLGYVTARTDLQNAERPGKVYDFSDRPNLAEDYEKWRTLGRDVFGKGEVPAGAK